MSKKKKTIVKITHNCSQNKPHKNENGFVFEISDMEKDVVTGYVYNLTLYHALCFAELISPDEVENTVVHALERCENNPDFEFELMTVLKWKILEQSEKEYDDYSQMYCDWFYAIIETVQKNLTQEEYDEFLRRFNIKEHLE